jgi:hypothetical protein
MKITKRQLRKIIREAIGQSSDNNEDSVENLATELGLERSDALLGAAMELEARDPELSYVGRRGQMGADVYLRYDNTYTVEAYGERYDGLDSQELLDLLEQI